MLTSVAFLILELEFLCSDFPFSMIAPLSTEEGHFDDVECLANFDFVCECDDYPAVPANF